MWRWRPQGVVDGEADDVIGFGEGFRFDDDRVFLSQFSWRQLAFIHLISVR